MAQSGYTPILIYASGTTGNTPSASNLTSSSSGAELALNYFDGKLFYKDSGGTVQVLAGKGGTGVVAGSNTQIQFNNNGVFGAAAGLTWDGTYLTVNSIKDSALTSGRVAYAGASGLLQDSANLTFDGTSLTLGGNPTLSAGTANGVLYLNGSKVATSGSALTFDGTTFATTARTSSANGAWVGSGAVMGWGAAGTFSNYIVGDTTSNYLLFQVNSAEGMRLTSTGLGIGTSSPAVKLHLYGVTTNIPKQYLENGDVSVGGQIACQYFYSRNTGNNWFSGIDAYVPSGAPGVNFTDLRFYTTSTERMRLDSSGNVGIGTTSPSYKIDVNLGQIRALETGTGTGDGGLIGSTVSADGNAGILFQTNGASRWNITTTGTNGANLRFYNYALGYNVATFDSSGNLGLGVTPSNAYTPGKALQIVSGGATLFGANTIATLAQNININVSGVGTYQQNGYATTYIQTSGQHQWSTAPSGTAGNTISFTQAMTLDASGNLLVGTTSSSIGASGRGVIEVNGTSDSVFASKVNGTLAAVSGLASSTEVIYGAVTNVPVLFRTNNTERARITSGGSFWVGSTGISTSYRFEVVNTGVGKYGGIFKNDDQPSATLDLWNASTSGDAVFAGFYTEATATGRGTISYNRVGGLVAYNTTSDYRAKDIIGPVQNPGATIDALKVYEGKMKGATQSRPMLVAHEAQAVAPYSVTGEKDAVNDKGEPVYQQMDVSSLVPLLLAEIQSLRARVAQLESK